MKGPFEWIFGRHTVETALAQQGDWVKEIHCTEPLLPVIQDRLQNLNVHCSVQVVRKEKLTERVGSPQHQGVIAKVPAVLPRTEKEVLKWCEQSQTPPCLLILDGIQDPNNLGACIRSAAAFGVDWLITPKDNAVALKPSVRKIACGTEHFIPWAQVTNLARFIEQIKKMGIWVFAASAQAESSIDSLDWRGPTALIFGAEHKGVRPLVLKQCDHVFRIPMQAQVESLNVSVASAICLYEISRQRKNNG